MRLIRTLLMLIVIAVVCVLVYNYWSGNGWTLSPPQNSTGINADEARRTGVETAKKAAQETSDAANKLESAVTEGALTAKIKSKMVLDDLVKARSIKVTTTGSVVTLSGTVGSAAERERAVRIAKETDGVTRVVDQLEVRKP